VSEVDDWAVSNIVWLDELAELSTRFPPPSDAMLTDLRIAAHKSGGEMQLEGLVRAPAVIDSIEQKLRNPRHRVEIRGGQQDDRQKQYDWRFKSGVIVAGDERSGGKAAVSQDR
jgi:hypothetical protein